MNQQVKIIGIGMDGRKTLTFEARQAIEGAELLIGAGRMLEPFVSLGKPMIDCYDSARIAAHIAASGAEHIAVLVSGDVGFYSAAASLFPLLKGYQTELIGGISTPVYLCAKLGLPWQDMPFISLHGADAPVVRNVCRSRYAFFLLGGKVTPADICRKLCEYGRGEVRVHIGENLASDNERITSGAAKDFTDHPSEKLCAVITENERYERHVPSCIDDGQFTRGAVPMTKAEVRGLCVAKLAVGGRDTCWDIGCGTGSVSVEMALRCPLGKVIAIDKNEEALSLTERNQKAFGCDNIQILAGSAEEFPAPDCVFIGGSGGTLESIIQTAVGKNPGVRIVLTAVSLETLHQCAEVFEKYGLESGITQIAVTRTKKVGSHTMLTAENPIFIIERKMESTI